jgi:hypothetical protein
MARPTKREWLEAWLNGLEKTAFTGKVLPELHYNLGHLTRIVPLKEEPIAPTLQT